MKIVITGGHFSPALAVIEKLPKSTEILFIGRKHTFENDSGISYEYEVCSKLNIPFENIDAARFIRNFNFTSVYSLGKFPIGFIKAFSLLKGYQPDIVMTFGGYIAYPVALAAWFLRIPIVLHEQTLKAGLANRLLANFASKIFVSFSQSMSIFPQHKTVLTGNPIREDILQSNKPFDIDGKMPLIYITGGSGGAHFINSLIFECIEELLNKYSIIHQTGDSRQFRDFDKLIEKRTNLNKSKQERYIIRKFIYPDQVGWVFKNADLIVGRAGINTICEALVVKVPMLLLPLSLQGLSEQGENAKYVKSIGVGDYLSQEVSAKSLSNKIDDMIKDRSAYIEKFKSEFSNIHLSASNYIRDQLKFIYDAKKEKKDFLSV